MVKPRDGFKNFQFRDTEALMVALCEHAAAVGLTPTEVMRRAVAAEVYGTSGAPVADGPGDEPEDGDEPDDGVRMPPAMPHGWTPRGYGTGLVARVTGATLRDVVSAAQQEGLMVDIAAPYVMLVATLDGPDGLGWVTGGIGVGEVAGE